MLEQREYAFQKQLKYLYFKIGDAVRFKGSSGTGVIVDIIRDINKVIWEHMTHPKFIAVEVRGVTQLYAPAKLKQIRVTKE